MKKFILIFFVIMLVGTTAGITKAQETYAEIDQDIIEQLTLNSEQASAYSAIMEKQRDAFFALKSWDWQEVLALYRETFALLKPVLTDKQYAEFVAIINSVIEDTGDEEFLVVMD
ncbi:hypothetical protein BTA51_29455 [Hahella sp. CCB-MM4]|uniref:hypothetical protein n=1 Tax=Hahella sp. (strain CCB-MM4) TaxID=1926491 RepID=UPI000B9BA279|nr:hypothetical protein [Hahella sp. CCB-MM4]OZG69752.1 hypothetical protein BTA51_29455 [Hahella sp. CCB-MM4]